jgi:autotransporter family porin
MSDRNNRRTRFARLFAAAAAGFAAASHSADAANVLWTGTIGDWNVGSNWDAGIPPSSATADIAFINNGGTAQIDSTMAISTGSVTLGSNVGHIGNLTMSGGTLTTTNTDIRIGGHTSTGGGTGTFTQTGGQVIMNAGNLNLGFGSNGASGTYNLSNGSLTIVSATIMAVGNRGVGLVNQTGGNVYIKGGATPTTTLLNLGRNAASINGSGTYNLSGGTVTAATVQFGSNNSGSNSVNAFNLSGTGRLITNAITIVNTTASNTFGMTGGLLNANTISIPLSNQGGTLAPAFAAFASADAVGVPVNDIGTTTFTVNNSYVQGPTGILDIDLSGAAAGQFDVLDIGAGGVGTATFAAGGLLHVDTLSGFDPAPGTTFDVVLADTITGLPVVNGTTPSGNTFAPSLASAGDGRQALRLTVVPVPEPGSIALVGLGLSSLAFGRRRRRSSGCHAAAAVPVRGPRAALVTRSMIVATGVGLTR